MAFKLYTKTSSDKNLSAEKTVILACISLIAAIIFDEKKKKPKKHRNLAQRTQKNYKLVDSAVNSYSAYRKKKQVEEDIGGIKLEKAEKIDLKL